MKSPVAVIVCALVGLATDLRGAPPKASPAALNEVVAAEHAWAKAAADGDAKAMASFMLDDYIEIMLNPPTATNKAEWTSRSKAAWVDMVRSGRAKYDSVELNNLKVYFHRDVATVTGEYSQKGTTDGKDNSGTGAYVDTWVRRNGHWQILSSVFP